jgi:hypothetical protein
MNQFAMNQNNSALINTAYHILGYSNWLEISMVWYYAKYIHEWHYTFENFMLE